MILCMQEILFWQLCRKIKLDFPADNGKGAGQKWLVPFFLKKTEDLAEQTAQALEWCGIAAVERSETARQQAMEVRSAEQSRPKRKE